MWKPIRKQEGFVVRDGAILVRDPDTARSCRFGPLSAEICRWRRQNEIVWSAEIVGLSRLRSSHPTEDAAKRWVAETLTRLCDQADDLSDDYRGNALDGLFKIVDDASLQPPYAISVESLRRDIVPKIRQAIAACADAILDLALAAQRWETIKKNAEWRARAKEKLAEAKTLARLVRAALPRLSPHIRLKLGFRGTAIVSFQYRDVVYRITAERRLDSLADDKSNAQRRAIVTAHIGDGPQNRVADYTIALNAPDFEHRLLVTIAETALTKR